MSADRERLCFDCKVPMQHRAASVGHTGCLYWCPKCGKFAFAGEPVGVRN